MDQASRRLRSLSLWERAGVRAPLPLPAGEGWGEGPESSDVRWVPASRTRGVALVQFFGGNGFLETVDSLAAQPSP